MALRKNEIAACACIALGVAAVLVGSVFGETAIESLQHAAATPSPTAAPTAEPTPAPTPEPTPIMETVRFSASGDDLIHDGIYQQAHDRAAAEGNPDGLQYDFTFAYENLREFFAGFDVNWLNQETLVNDLYEPSGYPQFSTPTDITKALYDIGWRVFSLSNNHSYDKYADGIEASLAHWATMPEDVVTMGFYNVDTLDDYAYQTVNGITFGYLAYTQYTNGLPTPAGAAHRVIQLDERDLIAKQIADMRPNCDVLVVSCHWGEEYYTSPTEGQREIAQWLVDQGVDLIIGTHPHVTQTAEWMTGADGHQAFVTYSLGNLISAQDAAVHPETMVGIILDITFEKTTQPDGSASVILKDPKLWPVITQYESGFRNIRAYLFGQYTDELGAAHGQSAMSREKILDILNKSVDSQFLVLE